MKKRFLMALSILTISLTASCGRAFDAPESEPSDILTDAQIQAADAEPSASVDVSTIVTPNNKPLAYQNSSTIDPQLQLNAVISKMIFQANFLMSRETWTFGEEGPERPAQTGLAYSWGGKDQTVRESPPGGGGCTQEIYGMDCSGFVYQCALAAGIAIPKGTASIQGLPTTWNRVMPAALPLIAQAVTEGPYLTGDIISWGGHIGVIAKGMDGSLYVFQSNGSPAKNCGANCAYECQKNIGLKRGPRPFTFNGAVTSFGAKYTVLRLVVKASGI